MQEQIKHVFVIMQMGTMMTELEIAFSTTVLWLDNRIAKNAGEQQKEDH